MFHYNGLHQWELFKVHLCWIYQGGFIWKLSACIAAFSGLNSWLGEYKMILLIGVMAKTTKIRPLHDNKMPTYSTFSNAPLGEWPQQVNTTASFSASFFFLQKKKFKSCSLQCKMSVFGKSMGNESSRVLLKRIWIFKWTLDWSFV